MIYFISRKFFSKYSYIFRPPILIKKRKFILDVYKINSQYSRFSITRFNLHKLSKCSKFHKNPNKPMQTLTLLVGTDKNKCL